MRLARLISISILAILGVSCEHDNIEDLLGPDLAESGLLCPSDDFSVVEPDFYPDAINFNTGGIEVNLQLSEPVNWEYSFTGTNGAKFIKTGFGDVIPVNWTGNTSTSTLFKAGDVATLAYKVACKEEQIVKGFNLLEAKMYDHILIDDFEGNGIGSGRWSSFDNAALDLNATVLGAPQGERYLALNASFSNRASFLGQIGTRWSTPSGVTASTSDLWFNVLVNVPPNATIEFRLAETGGDRYSYFIPEGLSGWQFLSVPYSEFAENLTGDGSRNPSTIEVLRVVIRSTDELEGMDYKANVDFISFTEGGPLEL